MNPTNQQIAPQQEAPQKQQTMLTYHKPSTQEKKKESDLPDTDLFNLDLNLEGMVGLGSNDDDFFAKIADRKSVV